MSDEKRLRVVIIGMRGHTGYVVSALPQLPEVDVVGIANGDCDDDLTSLTEALQEAGQNPTHYESYRDMLDSESADLVVVAGPFERTSEYVLAAIAANARVFAEKPLAGSLDALREIIAEAKHPDQVVPMMGLRFDPAFYTAYAAVQEGAIGEIRLLNAQKSYRLGKRPAFFQQRESSTGLIPWVGSHVMDCFWWFTRRQARRVYASHSSVANEGHGDLEVTAHCQVLYDDGVSASASLDYLRPANAPSHGDDRIRIAGTTGVIEVRNGQVWLVNDENDGSEPLELLEPPSLFAAMVQGDVQLPDAVPNLTDAAHVTALALAARDAADRRIAVEVPLV